MNHFQLNYFAIKLFWISFEEICNECNLKGCQYGGKKSHFK